QGSGRAGPSPPRAAVRLARPRNRCESMWILARAGACIDETWDNCQLSAAAGNFLRKEPQQERSRKSVPRIIESAVSGKSAVSAVQGFFRSLKKIRKNLR